MASSRSETGTPVAMRDGFGYLTPRYSCGCPQRALPLLFGVATGLRRRRRAS